jgi:tetratricopeptide (TPR) repeat protein
MLLLIVISLISDTVYVKQQLAKADSLYQDSYKDTTIFNEAESIIDSLMLNSKVLMDEILWRKSHLCFERGYTLKKKKEKKEWYKKGQKLAEIAIERNPDNQEAHFWFATNKGLVGKLNGILNSLFMVDDLKKEANKIIELDPEHAGAHMLLGEIYKSLPGFAGGDKHEAIKEFETALKKDSLFTAVYVSLANTYKDLGETEKAKKILNKLLSLKKSRDMRRFELYEKESAEKLLKEIEEKQ